jgi:hypothetical protein
LISLSTDPLFVETDRRWLRGQRQPIEAGPYLPSAHAVRTSAECHFTQFRAGRADNDQKGDQFFSIPALSVVMS